MTATLLSLIALIGVPYVLGVFFVRVNPGSADTDYSPRVVNELIQGS